ncbi:LysR substrate-binding domain-containing protein [Devosia nitrariae]|uniref:LysR family transcriptional regulator n=1 Tax=Devosia nitrariae TaxID=2071872 RepID=A0ABQ5W4T6_9HYPH|nr:LysR substrate-binding domain-containing protein [Devosia nitrariae]GLQ54987.1 LysR family transcriptional regulator [Devosia nitrariae]
MALNLPPLAAIRAFEAAARHLSFTKAAEELGMTQAAVSYQIKLLEERVGAPLFLRRARQVALTEIGVRLAPEVTTAFEILKTAFAESHERLEGTLNISVVPTFASYWLAQHIGEFQMAHPQIAIRLESSPRVVDFATEEFDLSVRGSAKQWPPNGELEGHLLLKAEFTPMLSPALAATIGGIKEPADLLKLPLTDAGDPWFENWFTAAGVEYDSKDRPQSQFGAQHLEAAAAMAGRGVAMLTPAFYTDELAMGRLLQPFDLLGYDGHGYWLLYPRARRNVPKIRMFRDWIIEATKPLREEG